MKLMNAPKPNVKPSSTGISAPMIKDPTKVGGQATVKMPKAKKPADPFGKRSQFFKSEDFQGIKRPSIEKLRAFLEATHAKANLPK